MSPDPYGDHTVLIPLWEGDDPKPYVKIRIYLYTSDIDKYATVSYLKRG